MPTTSLSTTGYAAASTCLKRYEFHFVDRIVLRPSRVSVPMRLGTWVHRCLEDFHTVGSYDNTLERLHEWVVQRGVDPEQAGQIATKTRTILGGYGRYWYDLKQEPRWDTVTTEEEIRVNLPGSSFEIRATIDRIIRKSDNTLWLVEHKTTADIPPATWRAVDPQTALQYIACHVSGKYDVKGIIFDYLLTRPASVPQVKKDGRFYQVSWDGTTTTDAFELAAPMVVLNWKPGTDYPSPQEYLEVARRRVVADGQYYQRFELVRPREAIVETGKDVRAVIMNIRTAEELDHYARAFHPVTCRRFCSYSDLCSVEYTSGRKSQTLRDEYFMPDDGTREGRI